ncbi:MAG TPA: hypothetical protein VES20_11485 [Bryobacteraceae bacterium]|nr:hypothetical protein [Bryobacteraceae bacterium]
MPVIRGTLLTLLASSLCMSAPQLTSIRDVLFRADGTRFEGVAQIEWKSFRAADGTEVPQNKVDVRIRNGVVSVDLVPTTNALTPMYYTVRFNADGRTQFLEYWSIPQHAAPLKLRDVRTGPITGGALTSTPVTMAVQDISGLRTELDLRPQRGSSWITGRTAVIGASGGIEGVIGDPSNCVRVDGTATPCGTGGSVVTFIDNEVPAGSLNGSNGVFTLTTAPAPASSLALYRNGLLQRVGVNYEIAGSTITFTTGNIPGSGDVLLSSYRVGGNSSSAYIDMEAPTGAVNGTNTQFALSQAPAPAGSLHLYRNGLLQKQGFDYNLWGNVITFVPGATPGIGDTLLANYRK